MADTRKLGFGPIESPSGGVLVVFADDNLHFGPKTRALLGSAADLVGRAAKSERFTGKSGSALDIVAPAGLKASRLIVLGPARRRQGARQDKAQTRPRQAAGLREARRRRHGRIPVAATEAMLVLELADGPLKPDSAADVALGATLRAYSFDRYKTKRKEGDEGRSRRASPSRRGRDRRKRAWGARRAVADGVVMARDLVNEPPNVLSRSNLPAAPRLRKLGVGIDVLDVKAMTKLGMGALLGVAGSRQDSRIVVMRWNGGKRGNCADRVHRQGRVLRHRRYLDQPAAGMEDMKGDMAGAACVVGLMQASPRARPRSTPSAPSAWSRTCRTAMRSARATS